MRSDFPRIRKALFQEIFRLYSRQPWLLRREDQLMELLSIGETEAHQALILGLLKEFHFLTDETVNHYLDMMAEYIMVGTGFDEDTTQVAALAYDSEADSSQTILHWLKLPLSSKGWPNVETVNMFGRSITLAKRGRPNIIFVDEFVGSGKTVISRMDYFVKNTQVKCDVRFCFLAGMDQGIRKIRNLGFDVFCPLILNRGISDTAISDGLFEKIDLMNDLEAELAPVISTKILSEYSFGYAKAEALYSLEGRAMNTPNSVFPIFWWPRLLDGRARNTLLRRSEKGLA